jgi:hypothetical protein
MKFESSVSDSERGWPSPNDRTAASQPPTIDKGHNEFRQKELSAMTRNQTERGQPCPRVSFPPRFLADKAVRPPNKTLAKHRDSDRLQCIDREDFLNSSSLQCNGSKSSNSKEILHPPSEESHNFVFPGRFRRFLHESPEPASPQSFMPNRDHFQLGLIKPNQGVFLRSLFCNRAKEYSRSPSSRPTQPGLVSLVSMPKSPAIREQEPKWRRFYKRRYVGNGCGDRPEGWKRRGKKW